MFSKLTDFRYQRSTKQAFGFYLAYLFLISLTCVLTSYVMSLIAGGITIATSLRVGNMIAIVACITLSIVITAKKGMARNFKSILFIILSGAGAAALGALGGLIAVSYLSTLKNKQPPAGQV